MDELTQTDRDNIADVIWWIKGAMDANKLNDEWSFPFNRTHVESLRKAKMQQQRPPDVYLENHELVRPIDDLKDLRREAERKKAVWHPVWGIKPASVIINMTGHVLESALSNKRLYVTKKRNER